MASPRVVSKAVELSLKEYKRAVRLAPGTIIQASDRQYRVNERGEWRRIPKYAEVEGQVKDKVEVPFHRDGRDPRTGAKCWCLPCVRFWKGLSEVAPID